MLHHLDQLQQRAKAPQARLFPSSHQRQPSINTTFQVYGALPQLDLMSQLEQKIAASTDVLSYQKKKLDLME